jgi:hypothetical protein
VNNILKSSVTGTTRRVYLYILSSRTPVGVRDVWRGLDLSSPSLAQYHINKLLELELIDIDQFGKFQANAQTKLDVLQNFLFLRGKVVPRLVIFGVLSVGLLIVYILLWPFTGDFRDLIVVAFSLFSASILFFEAYNQNKGLK